jgi:hypothetical protein
MHPADVDHQLPAAIRQRLRADGERELRVEVYPHRAQYHGHRILNGARPLVAEVSKRARKVLDDVCLGYLLAVN